jgi:PAS domain S-box-containing protein
MRLSEIYKKFKDKYKTLFEVYGGDSTRYTFAGDLNYESGRIFYIIFITLFLMLIYLPGDMKLHPFRFLAISIHLGYTLLSAVLIALRFTKRFKDKPGILLMILTSYLFIGTTIITATSGTNISAYIGPFSIVLMLPVFAPFPVRFKFTNTVLAIILFFSLAWFFKMDFSNYQIRYIINDIIVAAAISILLSLSQNRLQRKSWHRYMNQKNMLNAVEQREKLLNTVNSAANVLLSANDENAFEAALLKAFELVGDCLDIDRVQIWRNEMIDGEQYFVRRYEWLSDYGQTCDLIPVGLKLPYKAKPEWEKLFLRGEYINSPLCNLSEDDRAFLEPYGMKSIVIIPIFLERNTRGDRRQTGSDRRLAVEGRRQLSSGRRKANSLSQLYINNRRKAVNDRRQNPEDRRKNAISRRRTTIDRRKMVGDKGSFWGLFSIDDCRRERTFSDEEIRILTSVGLMMSNTINRNIQNAKIRKESEKSLAMAYWYESILNAIPLPITVTDADTNWTFINTAVEKFLGITLKDAIGKPCSNWGSEICSTKECGIECARRGVPRTYFSHKDSSYQIDVTILKDIDNNTMGHIEVVQDITNLKVMAKKQADAEAANNAKSTFLAKVSHEIRSPMNVILGITEMQLENEELSPDTREAFSKVYNSGYMLLNVINDILDLSKIEADRLELTPINYNVVNMINDSVLLSVMRFENKPVQFELKADKNIPVTLYGDELRIKQILNNILTNAFKYTDSGKVVLAISAEYRRPEQKEGLYLELIFRVSDTGRGMTRDQIEILFDEYTRFNQKASRTIEGMGLGMNITRRLVNLMNGKITVESEPDKGTMFTVRLPQEIVAGAGVIGKELAENINKLGLSKTLQMEKKAQIIREYMPYGKILIVDDMEPNLLVARGLLAPYGLLIETALSGIEAVEKIKKGSHYDVILMDHFMPQMDGMEAAKIIRGLGYNQPIVALTANALTGQAEKFLKNGFDGFITKPIDIRQLNEMLNRLIRDRYSVETVEQAQQLKENLKENIKENVKENISDVNLDLSYMKALVVDDFLPNLNEASALLGKYKMQADCVLNGQEAVNRIKSGQAIYDFILMDHLMPDMNGIETLRLIRSLGTEYAKSVPVIALTADESAAESKGRQMFFDSGFQSVLLKPLNFVKLDEFIKDWIQNKITVKSNTFNIKEKKIEIEIPGVDSGKINKLFNSDLNFFLPVIRSYFSVTPAILEKLRFVSVQTLQDYIINVHGVKSTSESIGAYEVHKMAAQLESMAIAGDLPGVQEKNEAFLASVNDLLGNIQSWLEKQDK